MSSRIPKSQSKRTRSSTSTSTSTSTSPLSITPITLSSRRASPATEALAESLHTLTSIYSHRSGSARRRRRRLRKQEIELKQQETTPSVTMLERMRSFFSRSGQSQLARQRRATAAIAATIECKQSIPGNACVACGDPLESGETSLDRITYYACPGDISGQHQHSQCVECFGAYVRSCCDSYAENSFPLKCPIPSCRHLVSDQMMRDLLSHECNNGIMDMYTKACIRSGILDAALNHDVTPVTCARCEKYTVLLPSNYKARAARFRLHQLKEAEAARKLEEQRAKEAKVAAQRQAAESATLHRNAMFNEMFEVLRQRRQRIAHDNDVQTQHQFARLSISLRNVETGDNEAFNRIRTESKQQSENKENKSSAEDDDDTLPPTSVPLVRQESDGMLTSLFCICETPECNAATCLRCDATVDADDTEHHLCSLDRIQELYVQVLDVLAHASVRRCPACNAPGRKDLSCCHMTCACGAIWCYVCGARNTTLPGGNFSKHNENWNIGSATTMCPMYLKYKFSGGTLSNGRYDGDPNRALARFHTSLQRRAIAEYEASLSSVDRALFNDMVSLKFPTGIWDASEIRLLDELEAKEVAQRPIEAARLAAAEAARVAAAEQARIQAEAARVAAEERARREAEERARREAEELARADEATRELRERLHRAAHLPPGPVPDAPAMEGIYTPPSSPSPPPPAPQVLQAERDPFQVYVVRQEGPQEVLPQVAIEAFFQPPQQQQLQQHTQAPAPVDPFAHIPQLSPQQQQALTLPQPVPHQRRAGIVRRPLSSLQNALPVQAQPITPFFQYAPQQPAQAQLQPEMQQAPQAPQAPLSLPLPVIPAPTPTTVLSANDVIEAHHIVREAEIERIQAQVERIRSEEEARIRREASERHRLQRQRIPMQRLQSSRNQEQEMNATTELNTENDVFVMLR